LPQPAHAHVDAAIERVEVAATDETQQLGTRQQPRRALEQHRQQPILGTAQGRNRAVGVRQRARRHVEMPVRELVSDRFRVRLLRLLARAPQHGANAPEQLAGTEGLGQIVVRADLEADDAIDLIAERRQHDDRQVGRRAQLAADFKTALARQHEIEHDEIVALAREGAARLLPIGDGGRGEAVLLEEVTQQRANFAIVVDDENVRRSGHGATSWSCQRYRPRGVRDHRSTIRGSGVASCNQMLRRQRRRRNLESARAARR
jgi:hypothetical protein